MRLASKEIVWLTLPLILNALPSLASESIGATSNGCILNAESLPLEGQGYQITHIIQERFFGHRDLVNVLTEAGKLAANNRWGFILIGDLSAQKGGKILENHRSHQNGLDVDILYRMPEERLTAEELILPEEPDYVDLEKNRVNLGLWKLKNLELLKYFAKHDQVDRIFVNPAIKKSLCESASGGREWLSKLRPWWGHSEHFHVRLKCPKDSPDCVNQTPLSKSDGCNDNLEWWLNENINPSLSTETQEKPNPPIPKRCE